MECSQLINQRGGKIKMDIKAILKKIVSGEDELTDEERTALASAAIYTQDDLEEEANARAAKARKQSESKLIKLESELDAKADALEEAKQAASKKPSNDADEKMLAIKKEYETKLENMQAELETEHQEKAKRIRKEKLGKIRSQVGFIDKDSDGNPLLDEGTIDAIIDRNFSEIDTDDLDRKAVVDPVVSALREKNPHLILDKSGGGTGHRQGNDLHQNSQTTSMSERQKELQQIK